MELELLDDRRGVPNSIVDYGLQLLWARRDRNRTERIHEMLVLGSCYGLAHQAVELSMICAGVPFAAQTPTNANDIRFTPSSCSCRDLRHGGKTRFPGRCENFDLLRIERLYCADGWNDIEIDPAGNKLLHCWCGPFEGHRRHLDAGPFLELLEIKLAGDPMPM